MKQINLPSAGNIRLLSAIVAEYPHVNAQLVDRRVKAGTIHRWVLAEVAKVPGLKLADTGWTEATAKNAYFYDVEQVVTAIAEGGTYEALAPTMSTRAKAKLREGLIAAYNGGKPPTERQSLLRSAKEWAGAFQRNITLTNAEVTLFDAITRLMRDNRHDPRISWIGLFKRWMGHFIVAMHPAMIDRDYPEYFAWVNGPDFDLLTLVGSLGYDDLGDFAEQLMLPISAAREPGNLKAKRNLWAAIPKPGAIEADHPLYAAICGIRADIAEATADATIGEATGIPRFRDAVTLMAMSRDPDMPDPDLAKIMDTLKLVQEAGLTFRDGQLIATDTKKAQAFHYLMLTATDPELQAIVKP